MSTSKFESVWDALYDDPDEAEDLKRRSDYLILISTRLNGQSGTDADKAERFGLSVDQIQGLKKRRINEYSLPKLIAIARKIGITAKV